MAISRLNPNDANFTTVLQMTGDQVDTGTGTLFGVPDKRQAGTSRLFLVISTGGSGQSAIQKAVMTARQKMENDFSVYSKFLVLDYSYCARVLMRATKSNILNMKMFGLVGRHSYVLQL